MHGYVARGHRRTFHYYAKEHRYYQWYDLGYLFSYIESDGSPNTVNKTADEVAAMLELLHSIMGFQPSQQRQRYQFYGYKDVYDLKNTTFTGLNGINASASKTFDISIQLRNTTGSDFQADGINMTMTFTLEQ